MKSAVKTFYGSKSGSNALETKVTQSVDAIHFCSLKVKSDVTEKAQNEIKFEEGQKTFRFRQLYRGSENGIDITKPKEK